MNILPNICCICWENKNDLSKLNSCFEEDRSNFYQKLLTTVQEMDFDEMRDSYMICQPCLSDLQVAYHFRIKCLIAKTAITDYMIKLRENNTFNEDTFYTSLLKKKLVDQKTQKNLEIASKININFSKLDENFISCENGLEIYPINFDVRKNQKNFQSKMTSELTNDSFIKEEIDIKEEIEDSWTENKIEDFQESNMDYVDVNITEQDEPISNDQLKCQECSLIFEQYTDYIIHMHQHNSKKPFECHICLKRFTKEHLFQNHLRTTHSENQSLTSIGTIPNSSATLSESSTAIGTMSNLSTATLKCRLCLGEFLNQRELKEHQKAAHADSDFVKNKFTCDICGRVLSRASHLRDHRLSHFKEKNYPCEECGKVFHYKRGLRKHMPIHSGLKPFVCPWCEKRFNRKDNLGSHQREHCKFRFQNVEVILP